MRDTSAQSANARSPITYRLSAAAEPWYSRDGSFLGVKFPAWGPTGLIAQVGLEGTFQAISETPPPGDLIDYRITQVNMTTLDQRVVSGISAQGEEIGRIQLRTDGTFSMTLQIAIPELGETFDLSIHPIHDPSPPQYILENGRLLLRGVELNTPFDEPYFGTPLIYLWADPES